MGSPISGVLNTARVGYNLQFSTNVSLYIRNGARLVYSYYERLGLGLGLFPMKG